MIKKIVTLFLLIFLFSNNSFSKSPPPGTGTSDVPANILIMLDNSGSMAWDTNNSVINANSSKVKNPTDVAVDSSGNIYALQGNTDQKIKVFDSSGNYLREMVGRGYGCNKLRWAYSLEIYNDEIYILDIYGGRIKVISLTGQCIRQSERYDFNQFAYGITVSSKYVYITSRRMYRNGIDIFDRTSLKYSIKYVENNKWAGATGLDVNDAEDKLVVTNYYKNTVCVHSLSGTNIGTGCTNVGNSSRGTGNGYFWYPYDAVFDSDDNIFVSDHRNHRVQKFAANTYSYSSKYGSINNSGTPFRYPFGLAIGSDDTLYVADYQNNLVQKFTNALSYQTRIGVNISRMTMAKNVIKKIVSNTELTSGANFGLMEWGWDWSPYLRLRVPINANGAKTIFNDVDHIRAYGGTRLKPAVVKARQYYTGSQSPRIAGATCQLNYIIIISDGVWQNHNGAMSVVKDMKNQYGIKTFAVGFTIAAGNRNNYEDLADAGGTDDPLYADDEKELLTRLTDAIKQAISGTLTYTTPAVMSEKQKGNFVYQSTFKYAKHKQWEGHLKKHKINDDGTLGTIKWDAADMLNKKKYTSRNLWTIGLNTKSTSNFTTDNRDALKELLFPGTSTPTDTEADNLINFIRGIDTYDEDNDSNTTESRHKLSDIYHSELIVVGPPEGSTEDDGSSNFTNKDAYYRQQNNYENFKNGNSCGGICQSRTEVVLAGSNGGILHAFRISDGEELWGYIPPNIIGKLSTIVSSKANATNAIYGIDGSPVVKDIYFDDTPTNSKDDPRWRTILLSGLGAGGHGYFALDITDINSPKHLFTIENDPFLNIIKHWDGDEKITEYAYSMGTSLPNLYDYEKLGEAWSTPRIIRIKVSGKDKWVAVFGGGYNSGVNPNYGSAVFVMDLENEGKLLKKIDIEDNQNILHNYVFSLLKGTTETYMGRWGLSSYNTRYYNLMVKGVGDIDYNVTGNISGDIMSNIKITFAQALPSSTSLTVSVINKLDIVNSVPSDLTVITANGTEKASYDGAIIYAADLEGKLTKINLTENFIIDTNPNSKTFNAIKKDIPTTTLFDSQSNTDNGRYIYKKAEATINDDNNLWLYFGTGNTQKLQNQSSNLLNRVYGIKDKDFPNFKTISSAGTVSQCTTATCPVPTNKLGWYVNLKNAQKVTAGSTIDKDRAYFPLYEPTTVANICKTGKAILMAYDTKCGNSVLNVHLGTGVLSKVVVQGDNLYVGIAGEAKKNIGQGFTSTGNLITGESQAKGSGGKVQLEGWREN